MTPVLAGAQQKITNDLTSAAGPAGLNAGKTVGQNMSQSIGKSMSGAGSALTKGVTAPLTAIGAAAVASWKEVDTGLDTIVQKTGASGESLESMSGILNNIATSIPTDFATAGAAIGEVNTRFGLTGKELESLSGQFVKFADLNGQDVSSSVDSVSKMMAGFGMEASEAGNVLDALNTIGQQTGVDVGTLADQVAANAAQFQAMGLSANDAASFLGAASMAGLDTSTAMMGLKTAMKNAAKDGVDLDTALDQFSQTMAGNSSESDKLAAAYELFGGRAGAAIENAGKNGTLNLSDFTTTLGDFGGSVSETFDNTKGPMDDFTTTMNEMKVLGADVVTAMGQVIKDVFTGLADGAKKVSDAWNSLSPEIQDTIIKIAGIAAVVGPLLVVGGKVVSGITTIAGGLTSLAGGITGLGSAASSAAGPVSAAGSSFGQMAGQALQLVAVAASIYIVAQGISVLADAAIRVSSAGWPAIAVLAGMAVGIGALMYVASAVGPALSAGAVGIGVFGLAVLAIGGGVALACAGISQVINAISSLVATISSNAPGIISIVTAIGSTVNSTITTISTGISTVIDSISGGISGVLDSLAGVFKSIGDAASSAGQGFLNIANGIQTIVKAGALNVASSLTAAAAGVTAVATAAAGAASGAANLRSMATSMMAIGAAGKVASTAMISVGNVTKTAMTSAASAIRGANLSVPMRTMMTQTYNTAKTQINRLKSLFSSTKFSFNKHIAVPHFSMSGSFDAKSGSVPHVSTSWYARAAELGARFTEPTIIGVGDAAQPELLLGENKLKELVSGRGMQVVNYITVDGAEDPEDWAYRFARQLEMEARMA